MADNTSRATANVGNLLRRAGQFEAQGLLDQAIETYSRAALHAPKHAEIYHRRGWAYSNRGLQEPAIRDFTRALEIAPDLAGAHFGRGWAYERQGHLENAIMDYSEAARIDPKYLAAYFNRGVAYFYSDRFSDAAADFDLVDDRAEKLLSDYALLWSFVSRLRQTNENGGTEQDVHAAYRRRPVKTAWPGALISLFKKDLTPADVLDAISKAKPVDHAGWQCTGYFFLGQYYLISGDRPTAKQYFEKTVNTGATRMRPYWAAVTELRKLDKKRLEAGGTASIRQIAPSPLRAGPKPGQSPPGDAPAGRN